MPAAPLAQRPCLILGIAHEREPGHSPPLVQAGQSTVNALWGEERPLGTWNFSTNGTFWAGKAGIPSIGFGPGDEDYAHTILEQVPLDDVVKAAEFYALFPKTLGEKLK